MAISQKDASRCGFWAASVFAGVLLLLSVGMLLHFQSQVMDAVRGAAAEYARRDGPANADQYALTVAGNVTAFGVGLNVCGLLLGLAFAFLGLAVFLYEIPGTMDAEGEREGLKFKVSRLSPGLVCLLCSTFIVWTSLSHRPQMQFKPGGEVRVVGQQPPLVVP